MPSEVAKMIRNMPHGGGAKSKTAVQSSAPYVSNAPVVMTGQLSSDQRLAGGILTLGRNLEINSIGESLQIYAELEAAYLEQLNSSDAKQRMETATRRLAEMQARHAEHAKQMTAADAEYRKAIESGDVERINRAGIAFKDGKGQEELDRIERETITKMHDDARKALYNGQDRALFDAWRTVRLSLVKRLDAAKEWAREFFADEEFQAKIREFSAVVTAVDFVGTSFNSFQDNVRNARLHGMRHPDGGPMPIGKVIDDALKGEPANLRALPEKAAPETEQFAIELDGSIELVSAVSPEEAWAKFVEEFKVPASRRSEAKIQSGRAALADL
jgi:hypothetical protein